MDLSVDILQLVVEYLPTSVQYTLIDGTPLGRHSCNQFFKEITFDIRNLEFRHSALQTIYAIEHKSRSRPRYVHNYDAFKAQYPFYVPNEIHLRSIYQLNWFCFTYGDEIHKFKAVHIDIGYSDYSLADTPVLNNVGRLLLNSSLELTIRQLSEKFGSAKWLNQLGSTSDVVEELGCFPDVQRLRTGTLQDFSAMKLRSLSVTKESEFHRGFLPSTLRQLELTNPTGKLDFSSLNLTSLNIETVSSTNYIQALFMSSVPQTLRMLELGTHSDYISLENTRELLPSSVSFPSLHSFRLSGMSVVIWNCMITPSIRNLSIDRLIGRLKSIHSSSLEDLHLTDVLLDVDFQFPGCLIRLNIDNCPRLRQRNNPKKEPLHLPESLMSLICWDYLFNYKIGKNLQILDTSSFTSKDISRIQSMLDTLPSDILAISINCSTVEDGESVDPVGNTLDLSRFKKMSKLTLARTFLHQKNIVLPPNVVELNIEGNMFSSLPVLPQLENLTIDLNSSFPQLMKVPPQLRWLTVDGEDGNEEDGNAESAYEIVLDLSHSIIEVLGIYGKDVVEKVILPKTIKNLHLHQHFDHGSIDYSLCSQPPTIGYIY